MTNPNTLRIEISSTTPNNLIEIKKKPSSLLSASTSHSHTLNPPKEKKENSIPYENYTNLLDKKNVRECLAQFTRMKMIVIFYVKRESDAKIAITLIKNQLLKQTLFYKALKTIGKKYVFYTARRNTNVILQH